MSTKTKTASKLLIDEPPLVVLPSLAAAIGLGEAIVLQQLNYLLQDSRNGKVIDGARYIYNTYAEWKDQYFCFLSESTIKRIFLGLEGAGLVKSIQAEKQDYDRRKFYTIDYEAFDLRAAAWESSNREKGGEGWSPRTDQNDPLDGGQCGPFYIRQRIQQRKPPTPRQEPGGSISSFPGKDTAEPLNGHDEPTDPVKAVPGYREWAKRAEAIPGAQEFLAIAGLRHFPKDGRQRLARSFFNACEGGRISPKDIKLVAAVRGDLQLPPTPEELIDTFADVAANAAQAAKVRLQEINDRAALRHSDTVYLLQEIAAANNHCGLLSPADLCDPQMHSPFSRWVIMACMVKNSLQKEVDAIKERVKPLLLEEMATDAGVAPFLTQIGVPLPSLGVEAAEIQAVRDDLLARASTERGQLERLLGGEEPPVTSTADMANATPAYQND